MLKIAFKELLTAAIFLIIDAVFRSFLIWPDSLAHSNNVRTDTIEEDQEDQKERTRVKITTTTTNNKTKITNNNRRVSTDNEIRLTTTTKMSSTTTSEPKSIEIVDLFDDDDEPQASQPKKRTIENESLANQKREQGNLFFRQQKYNEAVNLYSEAIQLTPTNHLLFGNRSASYYQLESYEEALTDANNCVRLEPQFAKGWLRKLKCHLAMGDVNPARVAANSFKNLEPHATNHELQQLEVLDRNVREMEKAISKDDYRSVVFYSSQAMQVAVASVSFRLIKAEALSHLHRYNEAQDIINPMYQRHQMNADVHYVRGVLLYYQEMLEKAIQHFQQAQRLHPGHAKALTALNVAKRLAACKEKGNIKFKAGALDDAFAAYQEALQIDGNNHMINAKLFYNQALVLSRKKSFDLALECCDKALKLDPRYFKAKLKRAQLFSDMEKFEDAVREFEAIYKENRSREIRTLLEEAKSSLKRSKRKDYYKILGVDKSASEEEVKRAYKKAAMVHHPDRHSHDTKEVQLKHEQQFKDIGEAYQVLLDGQKRRRYDMGADLNEPENETFDPNRLFNMFYSSQNAPFNFAHFG